MVSTSAADVYLFSHWITTRSKPSSDWLPASPRQKPVSNLGNMVLLGRSSSLPCLWPLFSYHSLFSLLSAPAPARIPVHAPDSRNSALSFLSARDLIAAGIHVLGSHFLKSTLKKVSDRLFCPPCVKITPLSSSTLLPYFIFPQALITPPPPPH